MTTPQFGERPDAAIAALREADRRLAEVRNAPGSSSNMPPAWRRMASPRYLKGRAIWNASRRALTSHTSGFRSAGRPTKRALPGVDVCSLKTSPDLPERLGGHPASRGRGPARRGRIGAAPRTAGETAALSSARRPPAFDPKLLRRFGPPQLPAGDPAPLRLPGPVPAGGHVRAGRVARNRPDRPRWAPPRAGILHAGSTPQEGRTPLGVHAALLSHWKDVTNAERMNYWLDMLLLNASLLREACGLRT